MPHRFVVCSTQRSGSTMVCEDLANQEVFGVPNEYFVAPLNEWREKGVATDLDTIMRNGAGPSGDESVKVMANQLPQIDKMLGGPNYGGSKTFDAFRQAFSNAHWIYIYRMEKDRQALSRIKASRSGFYHLIEGKPALRVGDTVASREKLETASEITYDARLAEALRREMARIQYEESVWMHFFSSWGIKPFRVIYEDAAQGGANYMAPFARLLDIQVPPNIQPRSVKRMSGNSSETIIETFRREHA